MVRSRAWRGISNHEGLRPPPDEDEVSCYTLMVRSRAWRGISNHEAPEYADDTTRSWSLPGRIPL